MAEYIDRAAFLQELINTPFYPRCETTPDMLTTIQDRLNDTLELLDHFPAAEVRPVVLCRDCKHYNTDYELKCQYIFGLTEPDEDDFCSSGERREGGATDE